MKAYRPSRTSWLAAMAAYFHRDRPAGGKPRSAGAPESVVRQAIAIGHTRLVVTGGVFALCFIVIAGRLAQVMLIEHHAMPRVTQATHGTNLRTERADIVDRNGVLLATSLPTVSLYANPEDILDAGDAARKLVSVLPELSQADVYAKLSSEKSFVWLRRNLTPRQEYAVNALGLPGVAFQKDEKRVYPLGNLTAHAVGFTDIDKRGLAGIEKSFDEDLRGRTEPLRLAIDVRIQDIMRQELLKAVADFSAIGAAGMVMDVNTGEVVAMVSLPDFNPNDLNTATGDTRFNRNTLGVYEMGSTFKIFTTAMALDKGVTSMRGGYDASEPIHIARFTIKDFHPKNRWLSVPEIFMYSSNIGSARMALDVGTAGQKEFLDRLGMLRPVSLELPEIGSPIIPSPWREINTMTIAYGHGLAVSPAHLAAGVAAVINGGVLYPPTMLRTRDDQSPQGKRVISAKTSDNMRRLMRLVVADGTGKMASVPGYLTGGKTGTAEKQGGGHYRQKALLSSFVGAFPLQKPRFLVLASIDEPQGTKESFGFATGGWVAAPVFQRVVSRIGPLLGLKPVDEESPQIKEMMNVDITGERRVATN